RERTGYPQFPVDRIAVRKDALGEALIHDDDRIGAAVVVGEVASLQQWDAEHREEARTDDAHPCVRVLLSVCRRVSLDRYRDARHYRGVAPWGRAADRHRFDAGEGGDVARGF